MKNIIKTQYTKSSIKKILLSILFVSVLIVAIFYNATCLYEVPTEFNSGISLSPNDMKEDLNYLKNSLVKLHPYLKENSFESRYNKIYTDLYKEIQTPLDKEAFFFIVIKALMPFKDLHTNAYYTKESKEIPLHFLWTSDGMIISEDDGALKKGDKIIKIGNKNVDIVFNKMKNIIPAENVYWVKSQMEKLLPLKIYLAKLGVIKDNKVELLVERNEKLITRIVLSFEDRINYDVPSYSYEINRDKGLGIFYLNECKYDTEFIAKLKDFFMEVDKSTVKKIAIDLRNNIGGNPEVIDEFLSYLDINECKWFYDDNGLIYPIHYINHENKKIYKGKVYILTSNTTCSGASEFAEIIKFNKLGIVIGEPTGNSPVCCVYQGSPDEFIRLPKSKLSVNIPSVLAFSPDKALNRSENTIMPDEYIQLTRNDILDNNDPLLQWIMKIN